METMIAGAKIVRQIMKAPSLKKYEHKELLGIHDDMTDDEWEAHIRDQADTIYHRWEPVKWVWMTWLWSTPN